jgi:hypothetical protein
MGGVRITISVDGDEVVLDLAAADELYQRLWDLAFTSRPSAVPAALRMRALYTLHPLRTIRFTGHEAALVREALQHLDATEPLSRDAASARASRNPG